ncbi:unnamed protein product [Mytilus edulis]|uniref:Uncharacterized protein n=1 Tax=Mytilus edulis TaxID=6550 RepID=A0A8S3UUJ2_MYTED|nr:unnamed protein product [Mytilus edulis]
MCISPTIHVDNTAEYNSFNNSKGPDMTQCVTPHDNVIHPTSDVVVVIIGAAAVIFGAVVLLLICWCRRHYSGRPYEEPNNPSPPRTEGLYEELTNLSPPRTEGPYEEPDNPSYPRTEGLYEELNNQYLARTRRPNAELEDPVSAEPGIYNVYDTIHDYSEVIENEDSSVPESSMMGNAHLDIPESVA